MEQKKSIRWYAGILFIGMLVLAVVAGMENSPRIDKQTASSANSPGGKQTADVASLPRPGYMAPDFTLQDLNGNQVKLSDLKGKKVLLNFWASWCPPCKAETPDLVEMSEKYKDQVAFYGVNLTVTDVEEGVKQFAADYRIRYPILMDRDGRVANLYQANAIPMTVTIDRNGFIVDRRDGQLSKSAMENMIKKLLER
ncbi:TlpA family protein disulfide reductase [Effusibacillus pohliae]|uniref:TlpA family protein disulfide reductase n=1 Tax=Effusibacillus pohliae TaxID=232270 RepID=UPI0003766D88|nr:TlpA disulfide reductase family protein [Effusibacillus pohliae]